MSKESLSSIRRRNGYSQEEVAHKMSVGRATVSRWENGIITPSNPEISELARLYLVDEDTVRESILKNPVSDEEKDDGKISDQLEEIRLSLSNELKEAISSKEQMQNEYERKLIEERRRFDSKLTKSILVTLIIAVCSIIIIVSLLFYYLMFSPSYKENTITVTAIEEEQSV
ncbi:Helix-turn-helix [Ruminococcaceae bacterium YRB3002]|nr:Helix-turn-helix [Ruminococcaceae bacterium YRB3002]